MRVAILTAMLILAAAPAAARPVAPVQPRFSADARECYGDIVHYAGKDEKVAARRLGELPPGNLILSVVRDIAGCQRPVIVRYGIGAGGTEQPRAPSQPPRPQPRLIR